MVIDNFALQLKCQLTLFPLDLKYRTSVPDWRDSGR